MKKLYIKPRINFEPIEDNLMDTINGSRTRTMSFVDDPSSEYNDNPGFVGNDDAPIVIGGDDEGDY